jgi:hypothetical protein
MSRHDVVPERRGGVTTFALARRGGGGPREHKPLICDPIVIAVAASGCVKAESRCAISPFGHARAKWHTHGARNLVCHAGDSLRKSYLAALYFTPARDPGLFVEFHLVVEFHPRLRSATADQ